jgi:hypothetical protein
LRALAKSDAKTETTLAGQNQPACSTDTTEEAKAALQILSELDKRFGQFSRHFQSTIKALRWEATRTPENDLNAVLKAFNEGASTPQELSEESHLSMTELRPILIKLVETGVVERRPRKGLAGSDRTLWIYVLKGTPAGSNISVGNRGRSSFTDFADSVREMVKP